MTTPIAAIVLAAGKGTRMQSDLHKVLHPIAGRPMLLHLLDSLASAGVDRTVVVTGAGREQVEHAVGDRAIIAVQAEQRGTAHAAAMARTALAGFDGTVLVCFGDTPLLTPETIGRMVARLDQADRPRVAVLAFCPDNAASYGRILTGDGDTIVKMVEYKDATEAERAVRLCNSGVTAVRAADLWPLLDRVGNDNAASEYYLPDIVMLAISDGDLAVVLQTDADEVVGINSRAELADAEARWQAGRRRAAMAGGATLVAPDTVWFAHDTTVGRDVLIEPHVVFGPGAQVADRATIRAFSHLEGAMVGEGAEIGPYARLRPGADIGARGKIGNFVEVKKATIGEGAKVNHLSYIGDADVGPDANIGAGAITCNYDGFFKYRTSIGAGAFIGSNSALVAPVTVGDGAIVGAGSVVTHDVAADALALERGEQQIREGWAARFRATMKARKAAR